MGTAQAEDPRPDVALTLADVVSATLGSNPDIQAAREQVDAARGVLTSAGTAFDTYLVSDGSAGRMHGTDPLRGLEAIQKQVSYRIALERCSTPQSPWYAVPADRKWYRNWAIGRLLLETVREIDPRFPRPDLDVKTLTRALAPPN